MLKSLTLIFGIFIALQLKAQSGGFYLNAGQLYFDDKSANTVGIGAWVPLGSSQFNIDLGLKGTFSLPLIKFSHADNESSFAQVILGYDIFESDRLAVFPQIGILVRDNLRNEKPDTYMGIVYGFHTQVSLTKHLALVSWIQGFSTNQKFIPNFSFGIIIR